MSDENDRIKRPQPERTEPLRVWSTLFGTGGSRERAGAAGAANSAPERPSFNDVVSRSVDLGYRVVDEYIRQGQRAAQRLSERSFGPDVVVTEVREMTDRMSQYASDVLGLWFDVLELAGTGAGIRGNPGPGEERSSTTEGTTPPADHPSPLDRAPLDRTRVTVEILSPYPTEVALDLRPDAPAGALVVHGLRAGDPEKPRLSDLTLLAGSEGAPLRLRIRVPEGQPAGTYSGLIIEERTSRPVGTVNVRITRE